MAKRGILSYRVIADAPSHEGWPSFHDTLAHQDTLSHAVELADWFQVERIGGNAYPVGTQIYVIDMTTGALVYNAISEVGSMMVHGEFQAELPPFESDVHGWLKKARSNGWNHAMVREQAEAASRAKMEHAARVRHAVADILLQSDLDKIKEEEVPIDYICDGCGREVTYSSVPGFTNEGSTCTRCKGGHLREVKREEPVQKVEPTPEDIQLIKRIIEKDKAMVTEEVTEVDTDADEDDAVLPGTDEDDEENEEEDEVADDTPDEDDEPEEPVSRGRGKVTKLADKKMSKAAAVKAAEAELKKSKLAKAKPLTKKQAAEQAKASVRAEAAKGKSKATTPAPKAEKTKEPRAPKELKDVPIVPAVDEDGMVNITRRATLRRAQGYPCVVCREQINQGESFIYTRIAVGFPKGNAVRAGEVHIRCWLSEAKRGGALPSQTPKEPFAGREKAEPEPVKPAGKKAKAVEPPPAPEKKAKAKRAGSRAPRELQEHPDIYVPGFTARREDGSWKQGTPDWISSFNPRKR